MSATPVDFCCVRSPALISSFIERDWEVLRNWNQERGLGRDDYIRIIAYYRTVSRLSSKRRNPWTELPVPPVAPYFLSSRSISARS